ncbi:hypothetical protein D3C86_1392850 [compost metagenome]
MQQCFTLGANLGRQRVEIVRFVQRGDRLHGRVEQTDQIGEGVAEKTGHAQGHVHSRTVEQTQWQDFKIVDALTAGSPHRAHAHQRHGLSDIVATGAHGRRAPHGQAELTQMIAVVLQMAFQNQVGRLETDAPRGGGRQVAHVHRIEVAAGGQHVQASTAGCAAGAGRDETTAEGVEQTAHFGGTAGVQSRRDDFAQVVEDGAHFRPVRLLGERACSRKRCVS